MDKTPPTTYAKRASLRRSAIRSRRPPAIGLDPRRRQLIDEAFQPTASTICSPMRSKLTGGDAAQRTFRFQLEMRRARAGSRCRGI